MSTTTTTESETRLNTSLEHAKALQKALADAPLRIVNDKERFKNLTGELASELEWAAPGEEGLADPKSVAEDLADQISYLRKLKYHYLEQTAKDKYVKMIVSDIDDAPLITSATNEELRLANIAKKEKLKEAKERLVQKYEDIRTLGPLVEQDYQRAKELTDEAATLSQKILDARLELTRLRLAHPTPCLTISLANAQLDEQVEQMQVEDEKLQELNEKIAEREQAVKDGMKGVDKLAVKRREAETMLESMKSVGKDDVRVGELYNWFTASLELHNSMIGLVSSSSPSENNLILEYSVASTTVTISLIFHPNTTQLSSATRVLGRAVFQREEDDNDGSPLPGQVDVTEVVQVAVMRNDAHGLVAGVLARIRAGV